MLVALGDRDIKFVAHAGFNLPQHGAFVFERVTLRQVERQPQYSHDHAATSDPPLHFLRPRLQAAQDLLEFVGLDDIPGLHIREVFQTDATFGPGRHLTDVILKTTQAGNTALMHDGVVTDHTDLRPPHHPAFADYAAGHRADTRDGKDLTHLGTTQGFLAIRRLKQALQCRPDVGDDLVNNAVEA